LLELLGSQLKASELREPWNREDFEEVEYDIDCGGNL